MDTNPASSPAAPSSQPEDQLRALPHSSAEGAGVEVIPAVHPPVLLVAAYCRVSTDLEEQEGSLESQTAHRSFFTDLSFLFLKFINDFYSISRALTIKKTVKGEEVLSFGPVNTPFPVPFYLTWRGKGEGDESHKAGEATKWALAAFLQILCICLNDVE